MVAGSKKHFYLAIALIVASCTYCPAPSNSASPLLVGIFQTLFRHMVTIGLKFGVEYEMPQALDALRRMTSVTSPSKVEDARVRHEIIKRENYNLHIFRPLYLDVEFASKQAPATVFIHGGGWTIGNVRMNNKHLVELSISTGSVIFAPDYRLAPKYRYPAALDDCVDAVNYVAENSKKHRTDRIVITGDSAGGHLSLTTALQIVKKDDVKLNGILAVYPVTQAVSVKLPSYESNNQHLLSKQQMASFISSYFMGNGELIEPLMSGKIMEQAVGASADIADHLKANELAEQTQKLNEKYKRLVHHSMSPLFTEESLLSKLPKTIIYVAEHDVLRDDGALMHERLVEAGVDTTLVEWSGAIHAQVALSKQFSPIELDPMATKQVSDYTKDLRKILRQN